MDNYASLIRQRREAEERRSKETSKQKLEENISKKMKTIMIGAIASIEQHFSFLWAKGEMKKLSPEEQHMKELFDKVRGEILDKGNTQIRNVSTEMKQYTIEWNRYSIVLPVIQRGKENPNNDSGTQGSKNEEE